jgi:hypothetical protein
MRGTNSMNMNFSEKNRRRMKNEMKHEMIRKKE